MVSTANRWVDSTLGSFERYRASQVAGGDAVAVGEQNQRADTLCGREQQRKRTDEDAREQICVETGGQHDVSEDEGVR